jgi:hypothetical protein
MAVFWVVVAAVVVVVVARAMGRSGQPRAPRPPRPGEDLERVEAYGMAPSDWVVAMAGSREEAAVAKSVLDASGIPAVVEGTLPGIQTRMATSSVQRVRVPPDAIEQAREVLGEQPVADPGDVGAEGT